MQEQSAVREMAGANEQGSPTQAERFFFDTYGYLVLENFLSPDHVARLNEALARVIERRRTEQARGIAHTGMTQPKGERSTRIFYILDDDPLFLEMLDWPPMMPYVTGLLSNKPHHHASDAIVEHYSDLQERTMGWHIDGHDNGFRNLGRPVPLLQLKIGYYLSDMSEPGQGNLTVVPGSHKSFVDPDPAQLKQGMFPGATQLCAPAGSALLFHNAIWHSGGPFSKTDGQRTILYYAYEHPWMIASQEHWGYPKTFYNQLPPEQRKFFHGFVFDPPEQRWG